MTTTSRIPVLDAVRGFALLGILVVNQSMFLSGVGGSMLSGGLGGGWRVSLTEALIAWLFAGKFILIFSFLFGWGIYTQAERGEGFRGRYLRRLLGLLLIGAAHAAFLFAGDILVAYALLGLFMLRPVRRDWPVRKLVRSGIVLLAVQAVILIGVAALVALAPSHDDAAFAELAKRGAQVYRSGDFWSVVPQRLSDFAIVLPVSLLFMGCGLLAMFRLGLAAAKSFAHGGLEAIRPVARRVLWPALIAGLIGNGACAAAQVALPEAWGTSAGMLQVAFFTPVLALGYAAAAVLILGSPAGANLAAVLGAAGRMSLSVYIGQSLLMGLLLHGYGLGLAKSIGPAGGILLSVAVYAALVAFSVAWMSRLRVGPLEWVLRTFTEWRWVSLRPVRPAAASATPA